jgi:hypothetical protein
MLITPAVSAGAAPSKTILLADVGTPLSQLLASVQLPLVEPIQVVVCAFVIKNNNRNAMSKLQYFIKKI